MRRFCNRLDVERLDWIVWSVLLALGAATGLLLLRGDRVGVRVGNLSPAPGNRGVSTRAEVRVTFDAAPAAASVADHFQIAPAVAGRLSWRGPTLVWRPDAALAAETRYTVTLAAGFQNAQGLVLLDDLTWNFHTGHPRVIYMSVGDVSQLYRVETSGRDARPLTRFDDGSSVWDFAVSPDGGQVVLSRIRPDGSAVDLWLMNADGSDPRLLLPCDESQCSAATWSPDGRRLAYERRALNVDLGGVGAGPGPTRVWLLDLGSGHTAPLFQDSQVLGYAPRWSPDGERLGYFDPQGGVRIVDLDARDPWSNDTGATRLIPNQLGEMGTWSPDGQTLVLVDLAFVGESYVSYLIRADLQAGETGTLGDAGSEASDNAPAWSPTGEWIAFGRKALADGTPTPGQQLWLMRPDGSAPHPLVTDPDAHLGGVAWSPDGRALAYVRFRLLQADARPQVWFVSLDGDEPVKLSDDATLPGWLP